MAKSKYERLIEHIINEDHDKASALFHSIVVEKSRAIYESLMDDDHDHMGGSPVNGLMDEIEADEEGMNEEDDEFNGEFGSGMGGMDDDMGDDMGDDFGGDDDLDTHVGGDEGDLEDRVVNIEDAIDELKAEFDRLMAGEHDEAGEEDGDDVDGDMGDEFVDSGDDMGGEEDQEGMGESYGDSGSGVMEGDSGSGEDLDEDFAFMREYVEKVSLPANKNEGGEVGSKGSKVGVNTKGTVAGKNDMGGTTANIVKGGSETAPDGTSPKSNAKKPSDLPNAGKYANVPGANAGKDWYKKGTLPANKSEGGEVGNGGKKVNVNRKSEITGKNTGNKPGKK